MKLFKGRTEQLPKPAGRAVRSDAAKPQFAYYRHQNRSATTPNTAGQKLQEASRGRTSLLHAPIGVKQEKAVNQRKNLLRAVLFVAGLVLFAQLSLLTTHPRIVVHIDETVAPVTTETYKVTVSELLSSSILNRSKITVNTSGVAAALQKKHPEIERAVLTVPLVGSEPTMYITLSKSVFVLTQNSQRYLLSASGYVTGTAPDTTALPLIADETGEQITVGAQLLPPSHVQAMQTIAYQLTQAKLEVQEFILPAQKAFEVDARLSGRPYTLRFNFEGDVMQQSGAAIATIEQLGSTVPAQYIDARAPGRVYYK